jgi:hypothetical protein
VVISFIKLKCHIVSLKLAENSNKSNWFVGLKIKDVMCVR